MYNTISVFLVAVVLFVFLATIWLQSDIIDEYEERMTEFTRCVAFMDSADSCLYILIPKVKE